MQTRETSPYHFPFLIQRLACHLLSSVETRCQRIGSLAPATSRGNLWQQVAADGLKQGAAGLTVLGLAAAKAAAFIIHFGGESPATVF